MKNVLLSANILLFVILLMAYTNKSETRAPSPNSTVMLGIDPELSRQMLELYRERIWRTRNINGGPGKDARSVWFSLDKLKAFVKSIEDRVGPGCTKSYGLGVRIYYSVYPDSTIIQADKKQSKYFQDHKLPMEYSNHHTVLMVPTYWNATDGHNYDFDPRFRKRGATCEFASIQDIMPALFGRTSLRENPRFVFNDSSPVASNKTFMIMPDNTDTRRFMKDSGFSTSSIPFNNTKSNKGGADEENYFDTQSDFTNGGSLIPPPYPKSQPDGDGTGLIINPGGDLNVPESSTVKLKTVSNVQKKIIPSGQDQMKMKGERRVHVPASGASYMRWVDETNDTGWVRPTGIYLPIKQQ